MIALVVLAVNFVEAAPTGNVHLATDYRLYSRVFAGFIESDRAVHHAMVGNRTGGVTALLRPLGRCV